MRGIKGKIAIVTGGARGLGKAMARKLLDEGAHVVIADRLEDVLNQTVAEFREAGLSAEGYVVDLLKVENANEMVDAVVEKHGAIDILVNNVGITIRKKAIEFSEDEWDLVLGVNLKSYFFVSCAAARHMIPAGRGAIVCISSENSAHYTSKRALYSISKGGVNALVGALGVEWARYGLRVNAVAPGFIDTDLFRSGVEQGLVNYDELMSVTPAKRLLLPEEIADAVCYLASEEASAVYGQTLFVDGGCNKNCLPEKKEL